MAVSFKIPKSPSRDVFVIDEFQGVDLTNTETSVDENKSPNAENMVRLVPGKVRKRTGYKTRVLFSDGLDVNRAKNTSDKYIDIDVEHLGDTLQTAEVLAEFYDLFPANAPIQFKFIISCVGEYYFDFDNGEGVAQGHDTWHVIGTPENPIIDSNRGWACSQGFNEETKDFRVYRGAPYQDGDYLQIKEIMISTRKSTSNAKDMPWSLAPEERNAKYVKQNTIEPIYGCHILKSYDVNRVVNVNRVLNTSNTFDSFTVSSSGTTDLYTLADALYTKANWENAVQMYVEFDYISDGAVKIFLGGWSYPSQANNPHDTNGSVEHYSKVLSGGSFKPALFQAQAFSGTVNFQIQNLSIMYQKDGDYAWSQAPEDNGGTFHIEDVYSTLPNNYAINDSYYFSGQSSSLVALVDIPIGDATSNVEAFGHITFDLETSTSEDISKIYVRLIGSFSNVVIQEYEFTDNIDKHFDIYSGAYYSNSYFKSIQIEFQLASNDATCLALANNITVKQIQLRTDYNIFAKNYLYHVGKELYLYSTASDTIQSVYSNMNQSRSQSWQLNDKLILLDGRTVFLYEFGETPKDITSGIGYIPKVTISKEPGQGLSSGTPYESLNLIQPGFKEEFTVPQAKASEHYFQLSFNNLDVSRPPIVEVLESGVWVTKTLNTDYVWRAKEGYVYFYNLPGVSNPVGSDTVRITAYKTVDGYADRIRKCTIGTLFGVGGSADRLFLSGNPDHPNWDFYSGQFDPTYFPDTGYSVLGSASSAIAGYAIVNNYLATFKDEYDAAQNVIIREGDLITSPSSGASEPAFKIINTLQGNGVIAPYSFAYLQTEPLFLTRSGVYAITPQDITGERYAQSRSFYLNGKLTKEEDLESAVAVIFNDQYILAINRHLYILDGLQPIRTDKGAPYATRQYAGFYCTNVPAACIWVDDQALWIGTYNGKVCRFDNDIEDLQSYNDDGEPIYSCWETPDLDGRLFYKNKTFRYFAIRIMNALRTSCKLYYQKPSTIVKDGEEKQLAWTLIKEDTASGTIFDFDYIDFERFSFNTDTSAKVVHSKTRIKKVDKMQFKVENDTKNEPFGLFDLALEYVESGNYKG